MVPMKLGVTRHRGHGWNAWTASGICECGTVWVTQPAPTAEIALSAFASIECDGCKRPPKFGEDVAAWWAPEKIEVATHEVVR